MAGATQRFQPANVGASISLRVAADPLHFGAVGFQMGAGAIDAGLIRDVTDIDIRGPRPVRELGRLKGDDMLAPDLIEL